MLDFSLEYTSSSNFIFPSLDIVYLHILMSMDPKPYGIITKRDHANLSNCLQTGLD